MNCAPRFGIREVIRTDLFLSVITEEAASEGEVTSAPALELSSSRLIPFEPWQAALSQAPKSVSISPRSRAERNNKIIDKQRNYFLIPIRLSLLVPLSFIRNSPNASGPEKEQSAQSAQLQMKFNMTTATDSRNAK